jgi:hypothetical protein
VPLHWAGLLGQCSLADFNEMALDHANGLASSLRPTVACSLCAMAAVL